MVCEITGWDGLTNSAQDDSLVDKAVDLGFPRIYGLALKVLKYVTIHTVL